MSKRIKMIIGAFVIIIAVVICLFPLPTKIDVTMAGNELTEDGAPIEKYTIHLKGWKHNYLFLNDTIKVDVQIIGPSGLDLNEQGHVRLLTAASPEWDHAVWPVYLSEPNRMDPLSLYLGKDLTWSVLTVNDRYFAAASDPNADPQEYWNLCSAQIS